MISRRHSMRRHQQGIALLEAMIAVVILAIGLLGTIGLQARAYSSMNDAGMRAEATIASQKLIGLMNTDQANLASYATTNCASPSAALATWCTETQDTIKGATISVAVAPPAVGAVKTTAVTVTIVWQRKAGDAANTSVMTSYLASSS